MKNDYEIRGEVTVIYLKRKDGTTLETAINTSDLERVKEVDTNWLACLDKGTNAFYCCGRIKVGNKWKTVALHRLILDFPLEKVADHINHNTLDNRKDNLRAITKGENAQNRKGANKDSKTGISGVVERENGKFRAFVYIGGRQLNLGTYKTLERAGAVAAKARAKYKPFSKEAKEMSL